MRLFTATLVVVLALSTPTLAAIDLGNGLSVHKSLYVIRGVDGAGAPVPFIGEISPGNVEIVSSKAGVWSRFLYPDVCSIVLRSVATGETVVATGVTPGSIVVSFAVGYLDARACDGHGRAVSDSGAVEFDIPAVVPLKPGRYDLDIGGVVIPGVEIRDGETLCVEIPDSNGELPGRVAPRLLETAVPLPS